MYLCVGLPGASVSNDHSMNKSFPEGFPKGSRQVCCCVLAHLMVRGTGESCLAKVFHKLHFTILCTLKVYFLVFSTNEDVTLTSDP